MPGADAAYRRTLLRCIDDVIDGDIEQTPEGGVFFSECRFEAGHFHGSRRIEEIARVSPALLPLAAGGRGDGPLPQLKELLFLDTETTGLSGGAGTCAFMLGLGWFEGEAFVVRQYFLRELDEEGAMLHALGEIASRHRAMVTFNGKGYDQSLLETRCVLHRRPSPLAQLWHIDLLHTARRLWGHRLESCTLISLERALLGLERVEDTPGSKIPSLYFDYLYTGNAGPLAGVFHHNRLDIVSLAALLARVVAQVESAEEADTALTAGDLLGVAKAFERLSDAEAPTRRRVLEQACDAARAGRGTERSRRLSYERLFQQLRRESRFAEGAALCQQWAADHPDDPAPRIELAKHAEHREHAFERALAFTLEACAVVRDPALLAELQHRRRRLETRMARRRGKTPRLSG